VHILGRNQSRVGGGHPPLRILVLWFQARQCGYRLTSHAFQTLFEFSLEGDSRILGVLLQLPNQGPFLGRTHLSSPVLIFSLD
jgi:hypothetical protein